METLVLIYSAHSSSRLRYTATFVFRDVLGMRPLVTTSIDELVSFSGPKINYSQNDIGSALKIVPSGLMFETGIDKQDITAGSWHDVPVFFITDPEGEMSFDLFSAVFWMISRYEEYLPFVPDKYGRFPGIESFAFRNGFLEIPVVDKWIMLLAQMIGNRYPEVKPLCNKFTWISTIDVDNAWAYLNRNRFITCMSLIKSFLSGKNFISRLAVLKRKEKDPYFTFDLLKELHEDDPEKLIFFFLSGRTGGINGRISTKKKDWQELIRKLSGSFRIGIHPSSLAHGDQKILQEEISVLNAVTGMPVMLSRQHYLLLKFPRTYREIIQAGIWEDYSMGFADLPGFRAGTSFPFYFYDLGSEEATNLRIWPFAVMDRTLKDYMGLTPEEALERIISLIRNMGDSGGTFISLWHNDGLSDSEEWKGWKNTYRGMISYLKSMKR